MFDLGGHLGVINLVLNNLLQVCRKDTVIEILFLGHFFTPIHRHLGLNLCLCFLKRLQHLLLEPLGLGPNKLVNIIDEVQHGPGLFRHLKVAADADRARNGRFLLTGLQKFALMKNVSESLAGRADIVELETPSFAEIREALPRTELETAIVRRGFPEWPAAIKKSR